MNGVTDAMTAGVNCVDMGPQAANNKKEPNSQLLVDVLHMLQQCDRFPEFKKLTYKVSE